MRPAAAVSDAQKLNKNSVAVEMAANANFACRVRSTIFNALFSVTAEIVTINRIYTVADSVDCVGLT